MRHAQRFWGDFRVFPKGHQGACATCTKEVGLAADALNNQALKGEEGGWRRGGRSDRGSDSDERLALDQAPPAAYHMVAGPGIGPECQGV